MLSEAHVKTYLVSYSGSSFKCFFFLPLIPAGLNQTSEDCNFTPVFFFFCKRAEALTGLMEIRCGLFFKSSQPFFSGGCVDLGSA